MSIHLPPDLARSLRRIDDYCKVIQEMIIERHSGWKPDVSEATDLIIVEAVRIANDTEDMED